MFSQLQKTCFLLLVLVGLSEKMAGQSSCPNSDFSMGDFTNWEGYYGNFYNPAIYTGFDTARHVIIHNGYLDERTCYQLFTLPPGDSVAARLGNDDIGAEAEQLRYALTVTPQTNLFIYKYAVVLEDPGHIPEHQPSFTIEVTDENGQLIDPQCGYYYVYAQQGLPGWEDCGNVVWKDWTVVGLNLEPYMGENIEIVFTTRDCEQTGHFGYAYLSASCGTLDLQVSYCPEDSSATITAPAGFYYLWNDGQTSQSIILDDPVAGSEYSCQLTAVNGCQVTINATVYPTIIESGFGYEPGCQGEPVKFSDMTSINQNLVVDWHWDFGDGTPVVTENPFPQHVFNSFGTYYVTLTSFSTEGCSSTITKPVTVFSKPQADFLYTPRCLYFEIPFTDTSSIIQSNIINWIWDFNDGSYPVSGVPDPLHYFETSGTYPVELVVISEQSCSDTVVKPVEVYGLPDIQFFQDQDLITEDTIVLCPLDSVVVLSVNDCGVAYEWTRKSNPDWLSTDQSQTLSNPGLGFFVESYYLHVINHETCISDDTLHVLWDFLGCVGVDEVHELIEGVYPNPSSGQVMLKLKQGATALTVEVINLQGKTVLEKKFAGDPPQQVRLDLTGREPGIYYLRVCANALVDVIKIVVN